jgi:hypothetical protein
MNKIAITNDITDRHPSIHYTGSIRGMKKLGYWGKNDVCVRIGNYIYNLSITLAPERMYPK